MTPCIAIIEENTLNRIALQPMLEDIFGAAEIMSYDSMEAFHSDCNRYFVHFFIGSDLLLKNMSEFETLRNECVVLNLGPNPSLTQAGFKVLDISRGELDLARTIISIHESRHSGESAREIYSKETKSLLSEREKEVLKLVVKGQINKEIADTLSISLPTVVFHRNNICEKLGTRSIGRLTVHAVLSGLVDINEL